MAALLWIAVALLGLAPGGGTGGRSLAAAPADEPDLDLRPLQRDLRAPDKWVRRDAVEKLVAADVDEGWGLVLEALADPAGEVSDTAQWLLGGRAPPELLRSFFGRDGLKSSDPWVRRRVAELVGRLPFPVAAGDLLRYVGDRDPETRRMLVWSLERLAQAGRLERGVEALGPLARLAAAAPEAELRARALFALAALDPSAAAKAVRPGLEDRSPAVRCAATALALRVLGRAEGEALLLERATDPALTVRTQAVDALAEIGSRSASRALVERLAGEPEERLSWRIVERLQQLSGRKHRRDPRPWLDWVESLPPDWRPSPAQEEEAPADHDHTVTLASFPIISHRVCFLIDLSGSIWNERPDGRTRKEVVDEELAAVLEALPEATRFNLVPYTGEPWPWQERLVPATRGTVSEAVRWFRDRREQGSGNVWDAALLALADPEVDTLVVLTDGVPTGGRHNHPELLVALFLELDATRKVAVDVILVDTPRRAREPWQRLARSTGGRALEVSMR